MGMELVGGPSTISFRKHLPDAHSLHVSIKFQSVEHLCFLEFPMAMDRGYHRWTFTSSYTCLCFILIITLSHSFKKTDEVFWVLMLYGFALSPRVGCGVDPSARPRRRFTQIPQGWPPPTSPKFSTAIHVHRSPQDPGQQLSAHHRSTHFAPSTADRYLQSIPIDPHVETNHVQRTQANMDSRCRIHSPHLDRPDVERKKELTICSLRTL
jgi:hypothetical protein